MITDPLFYLPSPPSRVILLGLSKGGFFGLGVMALPLMSLYVPPLQAAAIILPTVLAQDALTVWTYRRDWSAWNLKIMMPEHGGRASPSPGCSRPRLSAAHIRLAIGLIAGAVRAAALARRRASSGWRRSPSAATGVAVRRHRRLHHHAGQCRRPGLADAPAAAAARQAHLCRHRHHAVRRQQPR